MIKTIINFTKFLLGARPIDPVATKLATEIVGGALLERVKNAHPELKTMNKKQFGVYFGNPWLREETAKIYQHKGGAIEKSLSIIEKEINKLIN